MIMITELLQGPRPVKDLYREDQETTGLVMKMENYPVISAGIGMVPIA